MKKVVLILVPLFLASISISTGYAQKNKFVSVKGKEFIDPAGKPFMLKGTNLGNWLVPEGYMFHFEKTSSPRMIYDLFRVCNTPGMWMSHVIRFSVSLVCSGY